MVFTFAEAARIVQPTDEWSGKGFEQHRFDLRPLPLDEALKLRSCWVPCLTFATYPTDPRWHEAGTEAGMNAKLANMLMWGEPFEVGRQIHIMTCSKALMDRLRPGRCGGEFPKEDHIVFDGNHRLTKLALRRSRGHRDGVMINV